KASPTPASAQSDFAAELDALFSSAGEAGGSSDFDISLPDEPAPKAPAKFDDLGFDLEAIELAATDDRAGGPTLAGDETTEAHADFPAIFDQLDDLSASLPEAKDDTSFKPAPPRAPAPAPAAAKPASPVLPPEWNLEPVGDE